ncbi:MAG: ATP-binding protein [Sphingobacteriales bacterium]
MRFSDVIGQAAVKESLTGMVKTNRLSHALIFLAKDGTGGLPLALAMAQYLVCEKVNNNATPGSSLFGDAEPVVIPDDACGQCSACMKAANMVHPDIHYSYPVIPRKPGDKPVATDYIKEWREFVPIHPYGDVYDWLQFIGAENKQGNITAHECNDIIRKLNLKSFESTYKILLMWMPEYLGNEGNKLLKLIEEPPANTLFILVARDESKILPTILSRTQLVRIPMLSVKDLTQALIKRTGASPEAANQAASTAEGSYREAMLSMQHAGADWQEMVRSWLNATLRTGPADQVKWVAEAAALGREKQKQLLRYFNHLLEQSIHLQILGKEHMQLPQGESDFAERINKIATLDQQQAILQVLDDAVYHIERNANAKILFQALTIRIYHIIKDNAMVTIT